MISHSQIIELELLLCITLCSVCFRELKQYDYSIYFLKNWNNGSSLLWGTNFIENCSIIKKYSDIQKPYFSDQKYMDVSKDNDCLSEISSGDSGKLMRGTTIVAELFSNPTLIIK